MARYNQKYRYSGMDYPTNTGSETSPARVTIRCNCRNRARYKKAVRRIAETYGMTNRPQSEVWTAHILPMIEQFSWRQTLARNAKRK